MSYCIKVDRFFTIFLRETVVGQDQAFRSFMRRGERLLRVVEQHFVLEESAFAARQ
jgi:hypothetical protein